MLIYYKIIKTSNTVTVSGGETRGGDVSGGETRGDDVSGGETRGDDV